MNDIIKAMEERRSIRKFKPDMPDKKEIEQIIEAGLYAANGMGKQATITVAVTNKELRDKLSADNCRIGGLERRIRSVLRRACHSYSSRGQELGKSRL